MTMSMTGLESALRAAEERYAVANPASERIHREACAPLPGGVVRSQFYLSPFPLTLERGEGSWVWDADGHRYSDFLGEYGAGLFGHSDPVISAALKAGIDTGMVMGGPGRTEVRFAALLCSRFPSLDRVRFCNSGTEANIFALAAAKMHTGRNKILAFNGSYHGSCFRFAKGGSPLNLPLSFVFAPYNDPQAALEVIQEHAEDLAAVIVEPILASGGYIPGDRPFLACLREATGRHGAVLIFDEVVTSRMAPGGMQELLGIVPDMTTLGKYVGGGCSFGAFGGRADIMRPFDPREPDAVYHAGTFNNNRLSMTAGYAAMSEVFTAEAAIALRARGDRLKQALAATIERHGLPMQVTGFGSAMNVHFSDRTIRRYEDVPVTTDRQRRLLFFDLLARGFYCMPRGGFLLSLPTTGGQVDGLVDAFDDVLRKRGALLCAAAVPGEQARERSHGAAHA